MAAVFRLPGAQALDGNGNSYSGARLNFYAAGTTTPIVVYSDSALTVPISQPVVADSAGRFAQIFMATAICRVQLLTSANVLIADYDNFDPGQPASSGSGALSIALGGTGATTAAAARANLGITFDSPWIDVASAATVDLGAAGSDSIRVTGSTTITSFGTVASGIARKIRFAGVLTLTHNATSLILPNGGSNITTAAGDAAMAISLGSGNWIVVDYQRADGTALVGGASVLNTQTFTANGTWNKPATGTWALAIVIGGGGAGGGGKSSGTANTGNASSFGAWLRAVGGGGGGGGGAGGTGGGGGGGGGIASGILRLADLGATESVVVGASVTGQAGTNTTASATSTVGGAGGTAGGGGFGSAGSGGGGSNAGGGGAGGVGGGSAGGSSGGIASSGGSATGSGGGGSGGGGGSFNGNGNSGFSPIPYGATGGGGGGGTGNASAAGGAGGAGTGVGGAGGSGGATGASNTAAGVKDRKSVV